MDPEMDKFIKQTEKEIAKSLRIYPWHLEKKPTMSLGQIYYRPPSAHRRIYKPGRVIRSIASLAKWLDAGNYVFFRHKAYHPGWVRGFQLGYVMWGLKAGQVRKAVRINE